MCTARRNRAFGQHQYLIGIFLPVILLQFPHRRADIALFIPEAVIGVGNCALLLADIARLIASIVILVARCVPTAFSANITNGITIVGLYMGCGRAECHTYIACCVAVIRIYMVARHADCLTNIAIRITGIVISMCFVVKILPSSVS